MNLPNYDASSRDWAMPGQPPMEACCRYRPMHEAPRDGTEIIGLYDGNEVEIRYAIKRQCMLAGVGGGNGYFGEGWEDTYNHLIVSDPEAWRPVE